MKNLKRIFSLALAGTMLAGMLTVGASAADFTDDEKIVNQNAVDTMVALNIINGKDDGSFDPEAVVTRAEMAKMITVALNGGKDPVLGTSSTPKFTDIGGHWAQKYIEYCANLGIINGRGDGTFDPNGTVTGTEAAKMMLVAMGYDSTVFKFTGADWAINVNTEASNATPDSLYTGIETIDPSNGLSRDNAAQLIFNGIQDDIMEKSPEMTITNGEISYRYNKATGKSVLTERYKAQIWIGTFVGNSKTNDLSDKGMILVDGKLDSANVNAATSVAQVPSDMDISNIGEEVKVIFKDGTNSRNNRPDKNDTIYGVFNTGKTLVYNTTVGALDDDKKTDNKIKFDGSTYELATNKASTPAFTFVTNYSNATAATIGDFGTKTYASTRTTAPDGTTTITGTAAALQLAATEIKTTLKNLQTGAPIKFVCNEDGKIIAGYMVKSDMAVVLTKNSEKVTLNNAYGSIKIADNEVYEDIKKDDVVTVTRLYKNSADNGYTIVTKLEPTTGELEGYKLGTNGSDLTNVTIDGTSYKVHGAVTLFKDGLGTDAKDKTTVPGTIGETVELYLVDGMARAVVQTSESASNWSVVLEAKGSSNTTSVFNGLELQVMDAEGTKSIIKVSKDSYAAVKGSGSGNLVSADIPRGSLITYTINKDNEAVIKNFESYGSISTSTHTAPGNAAYNKDTKTFGGKATNTECVIFVETSAGTFAGTTSSYSGITVKAYKIRDLGAISAAPAIKAVKNDRVVAAVIDLTQNPVGSASTRVFGIVTDYNGFVKVDNDEKASYTVSVNGVDYTVYLTSGNDLKAGDIVSFEPANDNIYANAAGNGTDGVNQVTKIAAGANTMVGWVDEYDETDGTLAVFNGRDVASTNPDGSAASYKGTGSFTYAVNDDTKFYFVDQDNDEGVEAATITEFDAIKGNKNIIVIWRNDVASGTKFADVVIFEVTNEKDILNPVS